ncbi:MAG: S8 family serine peptidase [Congregibacter sp.]
MNRTYPQLLPAALAAVLMAGLPGSPPFLLVSAAVGSGLLAVNTTAHAQSKQLIEKKDDLPRHSYSIDVPVTALYRSENRERLLKLAREIRSDIESDLEKYDIRDDNTVQDFYALLGSVAVLEDDWQSYLNHLQQRRALESKEANRLTMGLVGEAIARAQLSGDGSPESVSQRLQEELATLPYATVEAGLKSLKGRTEILSRALVLGSLDSNYQPIVDRNDGTVSYDIAASLVGASFTLQHFLPVAGAVNGVLSYAIDTNRVEKNDIWAERQIALESSSEAKPVTLAIWDSGVDTAIFSDTQQLWHNSGEIPGNGIDDDDNGFVDDVHGVAYDLHSNKVVGTLYPIGQVSDDEAALQRLMKGLGDIQFNVDSAEAGEVRKRMASLPQESVKEFLESLSVYGNYAHGTHVAGIATEGNPFARVLVARMTYGHEMIPERPTLAQAHREAAMFLEVADYFRGQGVRVVNMSWGGSLRGIEQALEANPTGESIEERKALAREIYDITDHALRKAIADSPEILFVAAAGNSDNDIKFDEFYPGSYDYPNMLTVGAVDSAGDETSFTSLGKVDVYGNGFEVESYVPGGNRIAFNGTSMASPQVMNLAGKLLTLYPDMSVSELKDTIVDGADPRELTSRSIRLINPRATIALAQSRIDK